MTILYKVAEGIINSGTTPKLDIETQQGLLSTSNDLSLDNVEGRQQEEDISLHNFTLNCCGATPRS